MRPLTAGEHPHGAGPAGELVTGPALAQQCGQLGHVGFLGPATAVGAAGIGAGVFGAALAYLAAVINRDLPGLFGDGAAAGDCRGQR
jgi:hypothetical protein